MFIFQIKNEKVCPYWQGFIGKYSHIKKSKQEDLWWWWHVSETNFVRREQCHWLWWGHLRQPLPTQFTSHPEVWAAAFCWVWIHVWESHCHQSQYIGSHLLKALLPSGPGNSYSDNGSRWVWQVREVSRGEVLSDRTKSGTWKRMMMRVSMKWRRSI